MTATDRPQTRNDFVRSQALRATQTLLATHGLSVTMDQIAERSGISRRSLFRHFESRDLLVREALDAAVARYEQQLIAASQVEGAPSEWLTRVIEHTHRSHLAAGLAIWQLSSTADDELAPEFREVTRRRRAMRRRVTARLTNQAWEAAGGSGEPPAVVAEVMAMAVSSYSTHSLVLDLAQSVEEAADLTTTIILTVIEANLTRGR